MTTPLRYDDFMRILKSMATKGPYSPGSQDESVSKMRAMYRQFLNIWVASTPALFLIDGVDIYDDAVIDFGRQMASHSALAMPARSFFFQWDHNVLIEQTGDTGTEEHEPVRAGDTVAQITCMFVVVVEHTDEVLEVAILRGADSRAGRGLSDLFFADLYSEKADRLLNLKRTGSPWSGTPEEQEENVSASFLEELLAFLSVLSIKDVDKRREGPSERVKAKRLKRGLDPLPEYVRLVINREIAERIAAAGDRSSPRPHFRRGHLRTVFRGTDRQKLISVSPTWVKGEAPLRPYRVK